MRPAGLERDSPQAQEAARRVSPAESRRVVVGVESIAPALLNPASILALQRLSGNTAVGELIDRVSAPKVTIQCCRAERHAGCGCAMDETDQAASTVQRDAPTAAVATPPTDLIPGSPYSSLPAPVLDTLKRSFADRLARVAGSENNLDNAFWGGAAPTLDEALNRLGTAGIELIVEIFNRSGSGLWTKIQYVKNVWSGSSRGFNMVIVDIGGLETALRADVRFCRDSPTGESEHRPDRCYREIVQGSRGLHYCVHESAGCNVHIDLHQVVKRREGGDNPECVYRWGIPLLQHWNDVFILGPDASVFEKIDYAGQQIRRLTTQAAGPSGDAQSLRDLQTAQSTLAGIRARARQLATQGAGGEASAESELGSQIDYLTQEIARIDMVLNPPDPFPDYSMPF